jgi:hypothetical protein
MSNDLALSIIPLMFALLLDVDRILESKLLRDGQLLAPISVTPMAPVIKLRSIPTGVQNERQRGKTIKKNRQFKQVNGRPKQMALN